MTGMEAMRLRPGDRVIHTPTEEVCRVQARASIEADGEVLVPIRGLKCDIKGDYRSDVLERHQEEPSRATAFERQMTAIKEGR